LLAALLIAPKVRGPSSSSPRSPHLIGELGGGVRFQWCSVWYLSNCSEALIGAVLVRRLNPGPVAMDMSAV
jgi:hypothetical protein